MARAHLDLPHAHSGRRMASPTTGGSPAPSTREQHVRAVRLGLARGPRVPWRAGHSQTSAVLVGTLTRATASSPRAELAPHWGAARPARGARPAGAAEHASELLGRSWRADDAAVLPARCVPSEWAEDAACCRRSRPGSTGLASLEARRAYGAAGRAADARPRRLSAAVLDVWTGRRRTAVGR